ncbi:hypothetical protein [Natrinema halophilum]|uniref:DUF8159 domain-containing protein n=1 Tax=Natrinema halophilum TaxID=1699371 RepID=A0A7D5KBZ6_9EURY|nr:hypothetical protein [Natrinema halophilum]QLG48216.1 hypothetical protein HYG82_04820 [Natrinema halophilum]
MTADFPDTSPVGRSRRRFLVTAVAASSTAAAGCVGSLRQTSTANEIEPVEPSQPRKGTPGEFYTLVERNDIPVESLRKDGSDLVLRYSSSAETESESTTEIEIITTVYNENLVKNDAGIGMLYTEIADPFDGQARGWGVKTEWCERYNAAVTDSKRGSADDGTETNATTSNGTENDTSTNESNTSPAAAAAMILMSNVLNTRVYEEDFED